MCIIVDINTFPDVFLPNSKEHSHFSCIEKNIRSNKSKLIIGGTKFLGELQYVAVLAELNKAQQLVVADTTSVDKLQREIELRVSDPHFNDQHIVALSSVSRAKLVVTKDTNLQKHLRTPSFYNKGITRPSIFNQKSPISLVPVNGYAKKCLLCR